MSTTVLCTITKKRKQPELCPVIDEWVKKMWYICTEKYLSVIKKNEIMPFAVTWMQIQTTKLSWKEEDKYHMIPHTWNRKFDTNEPIYYETETESGTQRTDSWLPG